MTDRLLYYRFAVIHLLVSRVLLRRLAGRITPKVQRSLSARMWVLDCCRASVGARSFARFSRRRGAGIGYGVPGNARASPHIGDQSASPSLCGQPRRGQVQGEGTRTETGTRLVLNADAISIESNPLLRLLASAAPVWCVNAHRFSHNNRIRYTWWHSWRRGLTSLVLTPAAGSRFGISWRRWCPTRTRRDPSSKRYWDKRLVVPLRALTANKL